MKAKNDGVESVQSDLDAIITMVEESVPTHNMGDGQIFVCERAYHCHSDFPSLEFISGAKFCAKVSREDSDHCVAGFLQVVTFTKVRGIVNGIRPPSKLQLYVRCPESVSVPPLPQSGAAAQPRSSDVAHGIRCSQIATTERRNAKLGSGIVVHSQNSSTFLAPVARRISRTWVTSFVHIEILVDLSSNYNTIVLDC